MNEDRLSATVATTGLGCGGRSKLATIVNTSFLCRQGEKKHQQMLLNFGTCTVLLYLYRVPGTVPGTRVQLMNEVVVESSSHISYIQNEDMYEYLLVPVGAILVFLGLTGTNTHSREWHVAPVSAYISQQKHTVAVPSILYYNKDCTVCTQVMYTYCTGCRY